MNKNTNKKSLNKGLNSKNFHVCSIIFSPAYFDNWAPFELHS